MRNCNLPPVTSGTRAYLSQAPRRLLDVGFRVVALLLLLLPLVRATAADTSLEILFSYGSEKKKWVEDVTQRFNAADHKTKSGKVIQVQTLAMGSGKAMEEVFNGTRQAHLVSPASGVFIALANAEFQDKAGRDLVGETTNLILSPVVIAMWKSMAEALGWGKRPLGWTDILKLANDPQGWASVGHPEWGPFKFGHTHPRHSNSGILSLLAEVYAATGKTRGLTLADLRDPKVNQYLQGIERSIVHYGSSTGFFGRKMLAYGPSFLSAAVLYESMVLESYDPAHPLSDPLVAIYPKEGTFWSDHPVGIVERDWVTPEHREAAQIYIKYLLARPQQEKALQYGFRPGDVDIPVRGVLEGHGVDPTEPKTVLQVPPVRVMRAILEMWQGAKKNAELVLVMDVSGSMQGEKLERAKDGALKLLSMLGGHDRLSILAFNNKLYWVGEGMSVGEDRTKAESLIKRLRASGGTALYDAIAGAYTYLMEHPAENRIAAVVVLTDGKDTNSKLKLPDLLGQIAVSETSTVRVFPIGYGSQVNQEVMQQMAESTKVNAYQGDPANIQKIFFDISTYF